MPSQAVQAQEVTLLELLDRILNKGVVIAGDVVLSVADIPMIYLGLKIILTSVETMEERRALRSLSVGATGAAETRLETLRREDADRAEPVRNSGNPGGVPNLLRPGAEPVRDSDVPSGRTDQALNTGEQGLGDEDTAL
jgi:gas vesicle structural protein